MNNESKKAAGIEATAKGGEGAKRISRASAKKTEKLKKKVFEKEQEKLDVELVKLQYFVQKKGLKVIVVFEGRDAAGKGGVIKRITERVSPRVFRVVALPAPTEREKSQLYLQRYIPHFPAAGEVVIFDRSWYNRAGVERVMGFCSETQIKRFLLLCPLWERVVVESGIILVKYWFEVSQEEQTRRFESRLNDGRKIWKLSPMDLESHRRWYDFSRARDEMLLGPTPHSRRGTSSTRTTNGAPGSTASRICSASSPMRISNATRSSCPTARKRRATRSRRIAATRRCLKSTERKPRPVDNLRHGSPAQDLGELHR